MECLNKIKKVIVNKVYGKVDLKLTTTDGVVDAKFTAGRKIINKLTEWLEANYEDVSADTIDAPRVLVSLKSNNCMAVYAELLKILSQSNIVELDKEHHIYNEVASMHFEEDKFLWESSTGRLEYEELIDAIAPKFNEILLPIKYLRTAVSLGELSVRLDLDEDKVNAMFLDTLDILDVLYENTLIKHPYTNVLECKLRIEKPYFTPKTLLTAITLCFYEFAKPWKNLKKEEK